MMPYILYVALFLWFTENSSNAEPEVEREKTCQLIMDAYTGSLEKIIERGSARSTFGRDLSSSVARIEAGVAENGYCITLDAVYENITVTE